MTGSRSKNWRMTSDHFLSPEPISRIKPADFLAHMLAQYGAATADLDVRQTRNT